METTLKKIPVHSRSVFENLFQYYRYDMSEFLGLAPDDHGLYVTRSSQFDVYWKMPDHHPFFIYADGNLAGFILIRRYPARPELFDIDQFFILRRFKGQGVGKAAFKQAITLFPGQWQVRVLRENINALRFWSKAVAEATSGIFSLSEQLDDDLLMHFFSFSTMSFIHKKYSPNDPSTANSLS
ncbi:GNAT family N-acetyltransferase [Veronia pacifica]|uniref:Acetyltransferase n=1 Tax=Veronia pacifica TaxID=1080227 RepID=A0A1C3ER72_9GAMM|nr:GNAT family N-acetyltransferase [Veronia pacifica]ODA35720.1 acetyltransferase [Veronia pacifica]